MMHMEPCRNHTPSQADYNAPLYKTGARAGVLSTTGNLETPVSVIVVEFSLIADSVTSYPPHVLTECFLQ